MSNAINPNQMNIYNDIRKAKENHVNSSLKRLTKHVFCPKCNIQVRAANLEKHLAKHEVNPLMMPKIPHPPQPVRSPRKMKPPVIEIKKNAVKSSAVLRDNAEKGVSGWADKINRTGAELRALYEGKQLPKHKAEIRKAKFKATQDISCLICKTPLKSSNLNKHYKKVHGIDIQIQELEISGQEQAAFRKAVSMNYNHRCAITGDEVAVEACHIQTHANYFDNSLDNGVLLSVGLHRLFDAGIMIICPETMTISFTRNCFYKKYLDGALVKQGRIPISKKKLSEKNSGIKICHEITPGLRDVIAEQDGDYTGR
ncbi:TPA: HNH endonuclease [Klebsiella pneumoniae]|nr:HNH endonuclease [Klebsiella pneumoniae]HCB4734182.1 HNH endonuclease [Klebsiella pneumoniae]HCB4739000.1 HNH endonuclease [Klebsiella pneumoniae]HCB4771222.1 HNH endonuclease [Klebsiella pneumoniae]HCB4776383.1 HNH endonuclease [Klebsiella pneumoniae]